MAFHETYRKQVALLVRTLPLIAEEACFALKGGTAINLFVRDMPRLSVDIDLTYVPVAPRAVSLAAIDGAMKRIAARIQKAMPDAKITQTSLEGAVTRLIIRQAGVQTKIEVTPVLRGCVYEPQTRAVSEALESTANDRGTGPATSASPASPANEEERLWAIPLEAPELHDGAAALENRRELQRRMGGSSRLAPTGESNGISGGKRMVSSGDGRSPRAARANSASSIPHETNAPPIS
jgi:hypothetical protein